MVTSSSDNQIHWHSQYDIINPPVKPEGYVRFVVISDTHSTQPEVPAGVSRDLQIAKQQVVYTDSS